MADTTSKVTATAQWVFNYRNQCWDKVIKLSDGSYFALQWNAKKKKWSDGIDLIDYGTEDLADRKDDYCYWYKPDMDSNKDGSTLGQIWKWNAKSQTWETVSSIDKSKETYIIVHGLRNTYRQDWISKMARAISDKGQILCIDWGDESMSNDFWLGDFDASEIDDAAARAAILMSQLLGTYKDTYKVNDIIKGSAKVNLGGFESKINMIGHSFGAHLSAYFAKYLNGKIKTIYGLDSAEEKTQQNPIILGPSSASNVFFYKSSDWLGGGDTWSSGDALLGKFNFYLSGIYELTADDGLSHLTDWKGVGNLIFNFDKSEAIRELNYHSYAHHFFINAASKNFAGIDFTPKILEDIETTGVKWHGIVNGDTCLMECVTLGYIGKAITTPWNYEDYCAAVKRILLEPFFHDEKLVAAPVAFPPAVIINPSYNYITQLDMPLEIYSVAFMTSLDIQQLSICGNSVPDDGKSKGEDKPIRLVANEKFSVNFLVRNYADNFSFARDEVQNAQKNQHMDHEIWVSTEAEFNAATAQMLYSSLNVNNAGGLSCIEPLGTASVNASVEITDEIINKILKKGTPLAETYEKTGVVDLYMHVRVGVDKEHPDRYIAGELQPADNMQTQAIKVTKGGIDVAFVIDTTGSMGDEITAVRDALRQKIYDMAESSKRNRVDMPTMMLITFKDSYSIDLITNDMDKMLKAVNGLYASGGGDDMEYSNHALNAAINTVANQGKIFIATDAPSHKGPNVTEMVRKAKEKNISIDVVVTGTLVSADAPVVVTSDTARAVAGPSAVSETPQASAETVAADENADDTPDTATALTIGKTVTGKVSYIEDRYDWYTVDLQAEHTYSFKLDSGTQESFLTLYNGEDGSEVRLVSSGERFSVCPDTDGTYYLEVRAYGVEETPYKLDVIQTALPSTVGTTVESFSILATETGGVYLALNTPSGTADRTKYESAMYNILTSMTEPAVISVGPNTAPRGTTLSLEINGSNTNWRKGETTVTFETDAITLHSVEVISPTKLIAHVTVAPDCSLASYAVTVKSVNEIAKGRDVLTVSKEPASQTILSVALTSSVSGSEFTATIHGHATAWNETTRLNLGPDVTINSFRVVDATTIIVEGSIDKEASLGYRTVKVATGSSTLSLSKAFFVSATAALTPEIRLVTPHALTAGATATLILKGHNVDFSDSKVAVDFGMGIHVTSVETVDAETLRVTVETADDVSGGFRNVHVMIDDRRAVLLNALDVTVSDNIALTRVGNSIVHRDGRISDRIGAANTLDDYRFTATEDGIYAIGANISTPGDDLLIELCTIDAAGDYVVQRSVAAAPDRVGCFENIFLHAEETVYIRVRSKNEKETDYGLGVAGEVVPKASLTDNNSAETAFALERSIAPAAVQGWVGAEDACDFYRLQLAEASNLQLTLSGVDTAARVKVYAEQADGSRALFSAGTATAATGLDRTLALTAGSYYIEVSSLNPDNGLSNSAYTMELKEQKDRQSTHYMLAAR